MIGSRGRTLAAWSVAIACAMLFAGACTSGEAGGGRERSPRTGEPTRAGAEPSPTTSPAPAGPFVCTMVIGFSQTEQWYRAGFEAQVDDARWELFAHAGAGVSTWANPDSGMWSRAELYSPCASRSGDPDRILLTVSDPEYLPDASAWADRIRAAVSTIRSKFPDASQIVLQPVVGGPDGAACSHRDVTVRATFNQPYIVEAIRRVVGGDVVAGDVPEVRTCDDYLDSSGHIVREAWEPVGAEIGAYYRGR